MKKLREVVKESSFRRASRLVALLFGVSSLLAGTTPASGQLLQIPITSVAAGLAPGTSAAVCTTTALNSIGDGCPATQASLPSMQEVWTDHYGNIYIADFTGSYELRVVYRGGTPLANLITINNPAVTTPQVGYIYAIAGSMTRTARYASITYCNGSSGTQMLDLMGNGCPGYKAYTIPTGGYTDADGDVYLADHTASAMIRVIYAGGAAAANLIYLETGVTSPVVGSIYRIGGPSAGTAGYGGDGGLASSAYFRNPHTLTMDSSGNIYIADTGNNAVRKIDGTTGYVTTIAGANCTTGTATTNICTVGYNGDSIAATSAELNKPWEVALDANGNLYIADTQTSVTVNGITTTIVNNRVRVIYAAGTLPPTGASGISSPTVGYIYTIAGAGTSTTSGIPASQLLLTIPETLGIDATGSLYVGASSSARGVFRIDASTGIATAFAYNKISTWTVGAYCNGGSSGPVATDTVGDGCPAIQSALTPVTNITFAPNGMAFVGDSAKLVRQFILNQLFPGTAVGFSSTLPIAVSSASSFIAPSISAMTQGTSTSEFSASAADCTAGTSYVASTVCTYNITFTPTLPGRRAGEYVLTQSGMAVMTQGLEGDGLAPLLAVTPSAAATTVGSSIASVSSVTADMLGNLYASDTSTGKLWKIAAGSTTPTAILTGLSAPAQSAVDGVGNIYVADTGNNRIVEYTASGNTVSLLTGLAGPKGVAVTGNGTLYIANTDNNKILVYTPGTSTASTLPVTGLNAPSALALDTSGNLFIADTGNKQIVEYVNGAQGGAASFGSTQVKPVGLAVDAAGAVYVADALTNSVLRLVPGTSTSVSLATGLGSPSGIGLDAQGDLFYADSSVAGFYEVVQQQGRINFASTNKNTSSAPETASVANIGTTNLTFTSSPGYTATGDIADFSLSAGSNGCGTAAVSPASYCTLQATFTPLSTNLYTEAVGFQTNAVNTATASLKLSGQGENLINTATGLVLTNPSSLVYGETGTFTVTITPASGTVTPTGSIVLTIDGAAYKTVSVAGTATTFTASLFAGTHAIVATYSGDTVYASSHASLPILVGHQPTGTTLTYNLSTSSTTTLTLTAQVTPSVSGTPTGAVSFYSGNNLIGTATVSNGVAVYSTSTTTYSSYSFSAQYSGDTNYAASMSATVTLPGVFALQPSSTAITVVAGFPVSTTVSLTSYFGYSGTLTSICSGLPENAVCRFSPTTVSLASGGSASITVEFFTSVSAGAQTSGIAGGKGRVWITLLSLLASLILFYRISGARKKPDSILLPVLLLVPVFLWGITGCGGTSTQFASTATPTGTSTVTLTVSDTAGNSQTATYKLTVTQM
ncbi:MAG TPA: Ig-like domain repeat protein [Acidobacteriaceae bacterium]